MAREEKNILINEIFEDKFFALSSKYLRGNLIDIGCGNKPYKQQLANFIENHVGVDHVDTFHDKANIDLFGTAYNIPVADDEFDSAICTAVLEHLEEPELAIKECFRVLKIGSYCIYSVPFIWHLHEEPRDFYRYSKYGLQYLFSKVGFEVVEVIPLSGFWVTFGQLFIYYLYRFNNGLLKKLRIIKAMGYVTRKLAKKFDRLDFTPQWTWMYIVIAKKP